MLVVIGLALAAGVVLVLAVAIAIHRFGTKDRARPAAAIVVLGARVRDGGQISPALARRVQKGVALYRRGFAPLVLFTGGRGRSTRPAEAVVAMRFAESLGLPRGAAILEEASRTTHENAEACARILRARGAREVIVVSDTFHLFRAHRLFVQAGLMPLTSPAASAGRQLWYWNVREAITVMVRSWQLFVPRELHVLRSRKS